MRSVTSIIDNGSDSTLIRIECRMSNSLPAIVIVGFTHRSISESKERIRGALAACGIKLPAKRIIVSLAPADIPKHGSSFDLAILIAILSAAGTTLRHPDPNTVILGEVGLDGTIRPIRGIIGKIMAARARGITTFWVPADNTAQANLIPDVTVHGFKDIPQLIAVLKKASDLPAPHHTIVTIGASPPFSDEVAGQERAKRALIIAAAGHHNVLISGAPGTGKSMLARQLLPLLPAMTQSEVLAVTHIHSLISKEFDQIITKRPYRAPHHSASTGAVLGGTGQLRPGEISLSNHGILFLDELPEFQRSVIEGLREPLENHSISIARNKGTAVFPAHFLMVATANPCPCGYYGTLKPCTCTTSQLIYYRRKLSGPILDRIDLYTQTETINHKDILSKNQPSKSNPAEAVARARLLQYKRAGKLNSQLTNAELKKHAALKPASKAFLNQAAKQMDLSARSYIRVLRVAQTIADLENNPYITEATLGEALQYRQKQAEQGSGLTSVP